MLIIFKNVFLWHNDFIALVLNYFFIRKYIFNFWLLILANFYLWNLVNFVLWNLVNFVLWNLVNFLLWILRVSSTFELVLLYCNLRFYICLINYYFQMLNLCFSLFIFVNELLVLGHNIFESTLQLYNFELFELFLVVIIFGFSALNTLFTIRSCYF
jgi:hypothetical protein